MSIRGKRYVWRLVAGVALFVAALFVLPRMAKARGTDRGDSDIRDENQNTGVSTFVVPPMDATKAINDIWSAGVHGGATRLVVKPRNSLWSNARGQLHPDATLEQIGGEVQRPVELNRSLVGTNPRLILPEQELLLISVAEPLSALSRIDPIAAAFEKENDHDS